MARARGPHAHTQTAAETLPPNLEIEWKLAGCGRAVSSGVPSTGRDLVPLPPPSLQEHSCVINIGVGRNLDMLSTLISFLDPVYAEHLSQ